MNVFHKQQTRLNSNKLPPKLKSQTNWKEISWVVLFCWMIAVLIFSGGLVLGYRIRSELPLYGVLCGDGK